MEIRLILSLRDNFQELAEILPYSLLPTPDLYYQCRCTTAYQFSGILCQFANSLVALAIATGSGLSGDPLPLRRAVVADLGAIGYLPAADAIAQTLAENSLNIISLQGLLEYQVKNTSSESPHLSDPAIHIWTSYDSPFCLKKT